MPPSASLFPKVPHPQLWLFSSIITLPPCCCWFCYQFRDFFLFLFTVLFLLYLFAFGLQAWTQSMRAPPVSGTGILERRRPTHTVSSTHFLRWRSLSPFLWCDLLPTRRPFSPVSPPSPFRSAPQQHDDLRGERIQLLHRRRRRQRRPTRRVSGSTTAGRPPGIRNLRHNKLCSLPLSLLSKGIRNSYTNFATARH